MNRHSQHSQYPQRGPSVVPIVIRALLALAAGGVAVWIISSPDLSWREVAGALCAMVLNGMLIDQTGPLMTRRRIELDRLHRAALDRRLNTATWGGEAGQVLEVRYDPDQGTYHVQGWISEYWQIHPETEWTDLSALRFVLRQVERSGEMTWWTDEGTSTVRAQLDLDREEQDPGWNAGWNEWPYTPAPVSPEAVYVAPGWDDTVVQVPVPVIPGPAGPDPETLRLDLDRPVGIQPLRAPVFHTVWERDRWAREHDIPTEVLPVQPMQGYRWYQSS